jgi:hypothetical protein
MGFREDTNNTRGATSESINALPTYKFKTKKRRHGSGSETEGQEGGIVAAGTEERSLSAEDTVWPFVSIWTHFFFQRIKLLVVITCVFSCTRFAASVLPSMHTMMSFVNFHAHIVSTRIVLINGSR